MTVEVIHGDCIAEMVRLIERGVQVQAVVTDPPYHLTDKPGGKAGFMGRSWDGGGVANDPRTWRLCFNLLPPGGHLLAFGGTRTYHRMACAIEDAGFEIRDQVGWLYGQGYPKSRDISKAIDKEAGAEREVIGDNPCRKGRKPEGFSDGWDRPWQSDPDSLAHKITAPATPEAKRWAGWGTALKPAWEPICVARKPLIGTVASNVLEHGTGALNIDATKIATDDGASRARPPRTANEILGGGEGTNLTANPHNAAGRWPANVIHDGSDEVLEAFAAFGESKNKSGVTSTKALGRMNDDAWVAKDLPRTGHDDAGTAARFFYSAKAGKADRAGSKHPTVKPLALMRYLCKLVTPPGGTVLDPFAGSGTTLQAARDEGFHAIGIEREAEYYNDCLRRLAAKPALDDAPLLRGLFDAAD
jgi:site-specific DNA-methyltransferase (adenine-specific)